MYFVFANCSPDCSEKPARRNDLCFCGAATRPKEAHVATTKTVVWPADLQRKAGNAALVLSLSQPKRTCGQSNLFLK